MWDSYWVAKPKLLPFKAVIIAHVFYTHVLMGIGYEAAYLNCELS